MCTSYTMQNVTNSAIYNTTTHTKKQPKQQWMYKVKTSSLHLCAPVICATIIPYELPNKPGSQHRNSYAGVKIKHDHKSNNDLIFIPSAFRTRIWIGELDVFSFCIPQHPGPWSIVTVGCWCACHLFCNMQRLASTFCLPHPQSTMCGGSHAWNFSGKKSQFTWLGLWIGDAKYNALFCMELRVHFKLATLFIKTEMVPYQKYSSPTFLILCFVTMHSLLNFNPI